MKLLLLILISFTSHESVSQHFAIRNVTVIDVKTGKAIPAQTVIINGEKIDHIGPTLNLKLNNTEVSIDGTGKYLMPGLIDAHIHFFQSGGLYTRPDAVDLRHRVPYEKEKAFGWNNATDYMRRYLRLGITTVIDVGGPFSNFTVRDSIAKTIISPNILVTGPLFSIVERNQFGDDAPILKITTEQQADSLFAKMLPRKPDFIKIWYIANANNPAEKNFPLVKYIAEQTHKQGLKLAVHATELKTAQLAVDAGADILVHSIDNTVIPDDFVRVLREKKITLIPTLIVGTNYVKVFSGKLSHHPQDLAWANPFAYGTLTDPEAMSESELPPALKSLRKSGIPITVNKRDSISAINLVKLMRAGVNIATGTDAGNIGTMHASSYIQELEAMQRAGLTNAEILKASTLNAATGFGKETFWGTIEKGKIADLILLNKNPLDSLKHLNSIELVFKNGRLLKPGSIYKETAEGLVQRQLNAYNARDIDAFMDTYADSVALYDFPEKLIVKGKQKMREGYARMFSQATNLYCEIEKRIVIGNKIIDHEKVRRGTNTIHAVAVYEVENGEIQKVTFIR